MSVCSSWISAIRCGCLHFLWTNNAPLYGGSLGTARSFKRGLFSLTSCSFSHFRISHAKQSLQFLRCQDRNEVIHFFIVLRQFFRIRTALITAIYDKLLRIPVCELSSSSGQIMNYVSTDVDRIVNFANSFHQFWSLPVQLIAVLFLLYRQVITSIFVYPFGCRLGKPSLRAL